LSARRTAAGPSSVARRADVGVPAQHLHLQALKEKMQLQSRETDPLLAPKLPEHLLCCVWS